MAIEEFDDMFEHIGGFGRFQKILVVLSCPFNIFYSFLFFNQIFFTPTPKHWCHVPQLASLNLQDRINFSIPTDKDLRQCYMYNVNYSQLMAQGIDTPNTSWPITKCLHGWEYDTTEYYETVVSELNWVCDEDWKSSAAQTMCFVGSMIGTLVFGWAADNWGRLPALVISNLLACFSGIALAFTNDFVSFTVCRFISGLAIDTFYFMIYIILQEYVSAEKRSLVSNLPIAIFLTVGMVSLPWMAYAIWNWRLLALALSIPFGVIVLAPWIVPESSRWLLSKGKTEKAEAILRNVAKVNNRQVSEQVFAEFREASDKLIAREMNSKHSFLDLFRAPTLRKRIIVMTLVWMTSAVCYDGHVRNINNLDYSLYVTFTIAGVLELPADLLTILSLDSLGRRWTTSVSLLLSGAVYLVAATMVHGDTLVIAVMAMMGRFFITMTMNAAMQYTMELVPTNLRAQGSSLVHVSGHLATCFSPYIIYLGGHHPILPFLILGLASVLGGLLCLLLPETAEQPLPSTVMEAELFGRNQKLMHCPCLEKRDRTIVDNHQVEDTKFTNVVPI